MRFLAAFVTLSLSAIQVSAARPNFCEYYIKTLEGWELVGWVKIGEQDELTWKGDSIEVKAKDTSCEVVLVNGQRAPVWLTAVPSTH